MKRIKLNILGGGRLDIYGKADARNTVLIISRESFRLDDSLMRRLIGSLSNEDIRVIHYEDQAALTTRLIDRNYFRQQSQRIRQILKALHLLIFPTHWRHFSSAYRRRMRSINFRVMALQELIQFLGSANNITLIGRSAGARVATLAADLTGVRNVICLGYPFKHPKESADPARYTHLAGLATPCLILQGTRDSYGDSDAVPHYTLSPSVRINWVNTYHSFNVPDVEWPTVIKQITRFALDARILTPEPAAAPTVAIPV